MYYYKINARYCFLAVNSIQKGLVEIINVKAQAVFYLFTCFGGPLENVQLISFSAKPGNQCCHGNTFSVSWIYKYFYGFFAIHTLAGIGADYFFSNTW